MFKKIFMSHKAGVLYVLGSIGVAIGMSVQEGQMDGKAIGFAVVTALTSITKSWLAHYLDNPPTDEAHDHA